MNIKLFFKRIISRVIAFAGKTPEENALLLKRKGIHIGENVHIYESYIDTKYYSLIEIGNNVSISYSTILAHDASIKKTTGYTKIGKVCIGNNVFIGYGSIVLPGTMIGDNCIIGSGSVVRGKIPSGSLVAGNPAQVIGKYDEYIKKNESKICETNIIIFIIFIHIKLI